MSNHENETIIERKYEDYKGYIESLDYELLCYEFSDRMGCAADDWFAASYNVTTTNMIETLLDTYAVALHKDPSIEWDQDYRGFSDAIKDQEFNESMKKLDVSVYKINKLSKLINGR